MENYYTILGVPESAEEQKIKKAYKKLAVKFHPDKNPNNEFAEEQFKQINEAYQTLSNKELRATYDYLLLNLRYQTLSRQYTQTQPSSYRKPNPSPSAPSYANRSTDQKKGVTWALAILSLVAVVVISVLSVFSFLNYLDKQELAARRSAFRERLQNNLSADSTRTLMLEIIAEIKQVGFNEELSEFKKEILEEARKKAHTNFQEKSYKTALGFYMVWKEFKPSDSDLLNTRISLCHKYLGNKVLAKKMFEEMIKQGSNTIFAHFELAQLEETQFQDLENAIFHYEKASEKIVESYIKRYGRASYALYLEPTKQPEIQFEIYLKKGELYNKMGKHKECIIACNWASELRPNQPIPHFVKAKSELALNSRANACEEAKNALKLGFTDAQDWLREIGCLN